MQWMLETVDYYTQQKGKLEELNIIYKLEGHLGDKLRVETQKISEDIYLHQLLRIGIETEEILATAQTKWSKT
jgi:hypothetical protein